MNIQDIYITITITLASALFVLGLLFSSLCRNMESSVFRIALKMMVFAYCFFGLVNVLELYSRTFLPHTDDVMIFRIATLIVAVSQAFLFLNALILLIKTNYFNRKKLLRELAPIVILSLALVIVYFILPENLVKIFTGIFTLFYIYLLIKYTRFFIITYKDCIRKMDNFFSGKEAQHLRWANFSFYAALSIGLLALTASLIPYIIVGIICSVIYLAFYLYFAIRLINYGFVYKKLEEVLSDNDMQNDNQQENTINNTIENKLNRWINDKDFLQSGVTISDVAHQLGTNRQYLSEHINSTKDKTFRQWINELRIEYAKNLIDDNQEINLFHIAEQAGYTDSKYFSTCFKKMTGMTPTEYKYNNA